MTNRTGTSSTEAAKRRAGSAMSRLTVSVMKGTQSRNFMCRNTQSRPASGTFPVIAASMRLSLGSVLPHVWASAPEPQQPYRIIFIGEKSSLGSELRPLAQQIGAELVLPTGEESDTLIAGIAVRAAALGRPAVVLYFSDFDLLGWQMPVSVSRKLQALRGDLEHDDLQITPIARPVALTLEQKSCAIRPALDAAQRDRATGAEGWHQIMGREQTETSTR